MDFPNVIWPPLNTITPWSMESLGLALSGGPGSRLGNCTSATVLANQMYMAPFALYQVATLVKMSWMTGATNTGNTDLGVYDAGGNRVLNTGSQGLGTANAINTADVTDTVLQAGRYMMAITFSSSSGTTFQLAPADELALSAAPLYEIAVGSFGLPTTTTGYAASTNANPKIHVMALHFDTLV